METDNIHETNLEKKSQKTQLAWDSYMQYLIEAIDESNFMKRAESKPMATPKGSLESHVTSRATHVRNAANIIRRLAKGLNLTKISPTIPTFIFFSSLTSILANSSTISLQFLLNSPKLPL